MNRPSPLYGGSKDDQGRQLKKATLATLAALVAEVRNVLAAITDEEVAQDL